MAEEVVLMKGNEAIAHAAIRIGVDLSLIHIFIGKLQVKKFWA